MQPETNTSQVLQRNTPVLSVRHLVTRLQLGDHAYRVVDDLSFDLYAGKTLALVGESGCGKSMTALSLMRILPQPPALPPEGEVWINGRNLLQLSEAEMRAVRGYQLAMIFQDPSTALNPVYTVGWQLMEMMALHTDLEEEEATDKAIRVLKEVGISEPETRLNEYPHQLSGGMRQRVMIAMALLCEPEVLIADEPTTALDVTVQAQVLDLMRELQERRGMALLLITHDLGVVAEMADDVIVMYATQAVERAAARDLFSHQAHPYTQGLFASRPSVNRERGRLKPIQGAVPPLTAIPKGCHFNTRCPYVMNICREGEVPIFSSTSSKHTARCWLYQEGDGECVS